MTNELALMRRKHALTQTELGALIGVSQTLVGRIEAGDPSAIENLKLKTAFALHIVFGRKPAQLFQDLLGRTEDEVMAQAAEFDRTLDGQDDRPSAYKRALLVEMVRRVGNGPLVP